MNTCIKNIKSIFTQKRYTFYLLGISFAFFILNVTIKNLKIIGSMFSEGLFNGLLFLSSIIIGFKETIPPQIFVSVILISLLTGLLFTIMIYRVQSMRKITGQLSLFGVMSLFLGVFIPGCAACSVGVLGFLGITGAIIGFLPFKGFELQILSIVILIFSILYMSKNVSYSCNLDLKGVKKGK